VLLVNSAIAIVGAGHCLPDMKISNEELCLELDVTPEWIEARTGITGRVIAADDETASMYAYKAALMAIEDAQVHSSEIDLIIVSTFSGDYVFPAAAVRLHMDLGIKGGHAFDVQANCSGFVTALTLAAERMRMNPRIRNSLVVGLEFCSRYTDRKDPESAIYLSDGAGAIVIGRTDFNGFLGSSFWTDSSNYESVRLRGGGSGFRNPAQYAESSNMEMNGLATWRQAITSLPRVIKDAALDAGLTSESVDKFIFHQANLRLIEYLMKKSKRDMACTFTNIERIGNTGAASIAIAISEAKSEDFFKANDVVCIAGVGAGFTFGASIWRWVKLPT
jgi:3-oxoacyl-[acyl-carrier-protein] synthase-3